MKGKKVTRTLTCNIGDEEIEVANRICYHDGSDCAYRRGDMLYVPKDGGCDTHGGYMYEKPDEFYFDDFVFDRMYEE